MGKAQGHVVSLGVGKGSQKNSEAGPELCLLPIRRFLLLYWLFFRFDCLIYIERK